VGSSGRGGLLVPDHERSMMVAAFSSLLSHHTPSSSRLNLSSHQGMAALDFFLSISAEQRGNTAMGNSTNLPFSWHFLL
jgi:hypothetical protein